MLTVSCSNDDENISQDIEIQNFVWKGMNLWYNWQSSVPNLANERFSNQNDLNSFLNNYSDPEDLFEILLFDVGNTDRFSWIVDDYVELNNRFQGISLSYGLRLSTVTLNDNDATTDDDVIIYVRYVAPNSPANNADIKRGDIINAINGTILKASNISTATEDLRNETVTLSFVSESNNILTPLEDKTINATVITENPVHFIKIFNNIGGKKVGYLVYNGFRSSYNDELNEAFATLKAEGVNELILDLRLNGGGSVLTSAYLASMIYSNADTGKFADLTFNDKNTNQNDSYNFENTLNIYDTDGRTVLGTEAINRLTTVDQLYVLTSSSTASASEMIINGLRAYMPVKVVGTKTYGKNVGSITLYDSPSSSYTNESSASSKHLYAMQPIVFQIFNKNGESDYTQGFNPDVEVNEFQFWNAILPFGDENEVVLKAALDDIRGITTKSSSTTKLNIINSFDVKEVENRFDKEMYINEDFLNN